MKVYSVCVLLSLLVLLGECANCPSDDADTLFNVMFSFLRDDVKAKKCHGNSMFMIK